MKTIKTTLLCVVIASLTIVNVQAQKSENDSLPQQAKIKKERIDFSKNFFIIPRPGAYAAGCSFKIKESGLALEPWVEYFSTENNVNGINVKSQSLGILANYTFSRNEAYGNGFTVLFISSFDNYHATTSLGSDVKVNNLLVGLYGGYQYIFKFGLNIWLGIGELGMLPFNVKENIVQNEDLDAKENLEFLGETRWFPFPGIVIGYAF